MHKQRGEAGHGDQGFKERKAGRHKHILSRDGVVGEEGRGFAERFEGHSPLTFHPWGLSLQPGLVEGVPAHGRNPKIPFNINYCRILGWLEKTLGNHCREEVLDPLCVTGQLPQQPWGPVAQCMCPAALS